MWIDTIQLAVIVFVSIGIGSITPPMATCLMACSRVCDVPIHKLIKPILPFLLFGALPILLLVSFVPVVSTWLPGLFIVSSQRYYNEWIAFYAFFF